MPAAPTLPKTLTEASWNKEKGLIAKVFKKETGVGAALAKVKAAFDAIDWTKFDPIMACPGKDVKTMSEVEAKYKIAEAELTAMGKVKTELFALRDLADKVAAEFKKSIVVPKSATAAVKAISDEADKFAIAMKDNGVFWTTAKKEWDAHRDKIQRNIDLAYDQLKPLIKSIEDNAKLVNADPKPDTYTGTATKGFHQAIRGLSVALKTLEDDPAIKPLVAKFRPLAQDGFKPKPEDADSVVKGKVATVLKVLAEVKAAAK